jgi:hypothetical protein
MTEARRRLPSLQDLNAAAALLGVPGLDDADRNVGAPVHRQQAALLGRIAEWAGVSATAATELGDLDLSGLTERYAYLIETVDEADSDWWRADGAEGGGVEESHDSAATFTVAVMNRYLDHVRDNRDDYEEAISDGLHVRVSVWRIGARDSVPGQDACPPAVYGQRLKVGRISPRAVEVRTPSQVRDHVYSGGVSV